jgi:hypothetical protein
MLVLVLENLGQRRVENLEEYGRFLVPKGLDDRSQPPKIWGWDVSKKATVPQGLYDRFPGNLLPGNRLNNGPSRRDGFEARCSTYSPPEVEETSCRPNHTVPGTDPCLAQIPGNKLPG